MKTKRLVFAFFAMFICVSFVTSALAQDRVVTVRKRIMPAGGSTSQPTAAQSVSQPVVSNQISQEDLVPLNVETSGFPLKAQGDQAVKNWVEATYPHVFRIVENPGPGVKRIVVTARKDLIKSWNTRRVVYRTVAGNVIKEVSRGVGEGLISLIPNYRVRDGLQRGSDQARPREKRAEQDVYIEEFTVTVTVELFDGNNVLESRATQPDEPFTLEHISEQDEQPVVRLRQGDLSQVIDDPTSNLNGRAEHLTKLATFRKAVVKAKVYPGY